MTGMLSSFASSLAARLAAAISRSRVEKLQVVDNDHTALAPAVHRLTLRADSPYRDVGAIVEENRHSRKGGAGRLYLRPARSVDITGAERPRIYTRAADQHTPGQLAGRHF